MEGIETLRTWVQKPENFPKVDKVAIEELLPLKGVVDNLLSIEQEEMPDCRGIKHMGFDPYLLYDCEIRAATKVSPRVECRADPDTDSVGSMNSFAESWDDHPDEDPTS
jgi:hypothetical protein